MFVGLTPNIVLLFIYELKPNVENLKSIELLKEHFLVYVSPTPIEHKDKEQWMMHSFTKCSVRSKIYLDGFGSIRSKIFMIK